jgi:hypothetical protein
MREPMIVEGPVFSPGHCHVCGRSGGPMVDTGVDVVGDGRTYICVEMCLPLMAGKAGYLTPAQADRAAKALAEAVETINQLEKDLEYEREHKLLTVSDALALADRRSAYQGERVFAEEGA